MVKTASNYSVDEVCAIIKQCRESGVTQLKIGAFEASFLLPATANPGAATPTQEELAQGEKNEQKAFLNQERKIRLEQMEQMRLTDPEGYEDLVAKGEFEDAREESDGTNA